jgi:hypothetical protein
MAINFPCTSCKLCGKTCGIIGVTTCNLLQAWMQSQSKSHSKPKRSANKPIHAKLKFYRERIRSLQEKIAYKRSEIDSIITPKTDGIRIQSSINNHRLEQQFERLYDYEDKLIETQKQVRIEIAGIAESKQEWSVLWLYYGAIIEKRDRKGNLIKDACSVRDIQKKMRIDTNRIVYIINLKMLD